MPSYYQLIKPIDGIDFIFKKATERNLNPNTLDISKNVKIVALEISPSNLNKIDELIKDLLSDNIIFSTLDFERIIKYCFDNNIKIRNIDLEEMPDDLKVFYNEALTTKNYNELIKIIKENNLNVKHLELIEYNTILRIYDSGIIWINPDLSKSKQIISLFENILRVVGLKSGGSISGIFHQK